MRGSSKLLAFIADVKYFSFPLSPCIVLETNLNQSYKIQSTSGCQLKFHNLLSLHEGMDWKLCLITSIIVWKFWPEFWVKLETQPCFICCVYSSIIRTSNFVIYFATSGIFSWGLNSWMKIMTISVLPNINRTLKFVDFAFLEEIGSKGATQAQKTEGK